MNFFAEQDQARRNTRLLVLLFIIAVAALIAITNLAVAVAFIGVDSQSNNQIVQQLNLRDLLDWSLVIKVSFLVTLVIASVVIFKWLQLNAGGKFIAEALGGVRLTHNTTNTEEKRALNVVEEMAIASNMPVPTVYVLPHEKGINAFAAGNTPADAVIGLTRGALDQFDRDQLQGVVAHEFSHILNGDMRLNGRMIAMLSGITFIATIGEIFVRSGGRHGAYRSTKRSNDARLAMLGVALIVLGWLGTFFGSLIKAAISRQREFLADASAVQFTRNPRSIGDALKIIGGYDKGSKILSPRAEQASHMYIANGLIGKSFFKTHPPLNARIQRIEPNWDGKMILRSVQYDEDDNKQKNTDNKKEHFAKAAVVGSVLLGGGFTHCNSHDNINGNEGTVAAAQETLSHIPIEVMNLAHEPFGACAVILGLLLQVDREQLSQQLSFIEQSSIKGLAIQCQHIQPSIQHLPIELRWPLLELTLPALKQLSGEQYKQLKQTLIQVIKADGKIDLFEWCVFQTFRHYLATDFEQARFSKPKHRNIEDVTDSFITVLSCLAHHGNADNEEVKRAFHRGANTVGLYNAALLTPEDCAVDLFGKACKQLADCYPLLKAKIIKALVNCAKQDGEIVVGEKQIISAFAAVIDCPLPQLEIED